MIDHHFDSANSILKVIPKSALTAEDFATLARTIDPHIEENEGLAGLIIEAPSFPGWDSVGALITHLRFVKDHHRRIKKVAIVTDSAVGTVAERFASHFVSAEIKQFSSGETNAAKAWILE